MSFANGVTDFDLEDVVDEQDMPARQPEAAAKMKLAEQFWATPTAEALKIRAPSSGRTLSSQKKKIMSKGSDDLAFGIAQDRLHKKGCDDLDGPATVNTLLRAMPRPHHQDDEKVQHISGTAGWCSDDTEEKARNRLASFHKNLGAVSSFKDITTVIDGRGKANEVAESIDIILSQRAKRAV